jgi:hypothetical protein
MKAFYLYALIAGLGTCLAACTPDTDSGKEENPEQPALSQSRSPLSTYSDTFRKIVKTNEGILRGIDFGDELDRVFIEEDTTPSEDSARFVTFTVQLDESEQQLADIQYYFDGSRKVNAFSMDVYLNKQAAVDSLAREFSRYYSERFGEPVNQSPKKTTWDGKNDLQVIMTDVGIPAAPGLRVQIEKSSAAGQ